MFILDFPLTCRGVTSSIASRGQEAECPFDSKNFAKKSGNRGEKRKKMGKSRKGGKNWEKEEKSGRKGKNQEGFFTLLLVTERAGYATGCNLTRGKLPFEPPSLLPPPKINRFYTRHLERVRLSFGDEHQATLFSVVFFIQKILMQFWTHLHFNITGIDIMSWLLLSCHLCFKFEL